MFSKKIMYGCALTALSLASMVGVANAQSTASQIQEDEIIVTGSRQQPLGVFNAEQAPKARATIGEDYIETQSTGQTILQQVNIIPGVNFTNNDAYGSSGGNLNLRGFDGARISLTFDGIPLNDTGNYAIFSNQQLDPELITRANVNLGTTDVDSPTASAVGGTVNYVTRTPDIEAGVSGSLAYGSDNFERGFAMLETGEFGPWNTRAFGSASYTSYDQFVGPGELQKTQFNAGIYQPVGENGDFMRLSVHYNQNRNDFFYRFTRAQFNAGFQENLASCGPDRVTLAQGGAGAQNENNDGCAGPNFTVYQGQSINPSNTGNIRGQSRFTLTEGLTLTVDPSFQYVRANGGGTTVVSETNPQLVGDPILDGGGAVIPAGGVDLNFDGDFLDQVRLYSPSNTNTYRYGVTSSLIWDINPAHRIRVGYTYDWGRHRQTGEFGYLNDNGDPEDVFGGRLGNPIFDTDGGVFQRRNRLSIASLSQLSAEYRGDFLDDALTVIVGMRAPQFERDLNQFCYARKGNASSTQYCTLQTPIASPASPGFFRFDLNADGDVLDAGETQDFSPPFVGSVSYDEILPNVGLTFRPADGHQIFFSYAEGLSAPRTDDLYSGILIAQLDDAQPETTTAYDIGYRFQNASVLVSATVWFNQFENRIERAADPNDPTLFFSRNVGAVDLSGFDAAFGWNATERLFLYASAAFTDSEVKLTGFEVVETPEYTFSARAEYDAGPFTFGAQARHVGERFGNDNNTDVAEAYTVVDLDARWDLGEFIGSDSTSLQLNVINLFDEQYFGSLSASAGTSAALYQLGAPLTGMITLRTEF